MHTINNLNQYKMANTYSQLYIQLIFSVRGKKNLISDSFREELQKYMTGIIESKNTELLSIYCMPDHAHIFIGMRPVVTISELVKQVKVDSTRFINEKGWLDEKFQWQEGYGVFSYSHAHIYNIIKYIDNQPAHHKEKKFKEEYTEFLQKFDINYEERYLFDWI